MYENVHQGHFIIAKNQKYQVIGKREGMDKRNRMFYSIEDDPIDLYS